MVNIISEEVGGEEMAGVNGGFLFCSVLLWSVFDTEYYITTHSEIW